jgi:hypothetical protein
MITTTVSILLLFFRYMCTRKDLRHYMGSSHLRSYLANTVVKMVRLLITGVSKQES